MRPSSSLRFPLTSFAPSSAPVPAWWVGRPEAKIGAEAIDEAVAVLESGGVSDDNERT